MLKQEPERTARDVLSPRVSEVPAARPEGIPVVHGGEDVNEGWSVPKEDAELYHAAGAGLNTRLNWTHPNRIEHRMVSAVDVNGGSYYVDRVRGEDPVLSCGGDGQEVVTGNMPASLRRMAYAVRGGLWPP